MYIVESNTLIHADSSKDILEHYGVKGMKWGQHRKNMRSVRTKYNDKIAKKKKSLKDYKKVYKKENRLNDKNLEKATSFRKKGVFV